MTKSACQVVRVTLLGVICALTPEVTFADAPRILSQGTQPDDIRLNPLKDLNGYFPFQPSSSAEAWNERAEKRRIAMRVALGLWPMPKKTPVNAVVHGKIEFDDYTIEKVYLESFPGFYVTGNLYRPTDGFGKRPGVLCPHGHFRDGRFGDVGIDQVRREIVTGAERFEVGGRNSIQARCVQLARMGCVVFNYDMIGYADSVQISYELAHRFANQRPEMNSLNAWGLFSPQAESHLQSVLGLQCYNSIRALDWLETLPDVDPQRITVTGASGGGTQTFLLCAIDPRPAVAIPAVMVSTAMQGGCTCENASLLRISAGNVEFAALIAPRPLCLISANDWTKEMPTKGYPELRQHYQMLGAADRLYHAPYLHFGHNYNYVSRATMYAFVNKHLNMGLKEPIVEEDYKLLSAKELTVWNDDHPKPESTTTFERKLLQHWTEDSANQLANAREAWKYSDPDSLKPYREIVGRAIDSIVDRSLDSVGELALVDKQKNRGTEVLEIAGLLRHEVNGGHEELPTVFLMPNDWDQGPVVIWLGDEGKDSLYGDNDKPRPAIRQLLESGAAVVGADLFMQGEFVAELFTRTRRVANTREAAAYTFGYNHSLCVRRAHDVLTLIEFARRHERTPSRIGVVGMGSTGPIVALARTQAGQHIHSAVIDANGFRFGNVRNLHDSMFLPGGAKYDDLPGMLAIGAPHRLFVSRLDESGLPILRQAYSAQGKANHLSLSEKRGEELEKEIVDWLTK